MSIFQSFLLCGIGIGLVCGTGEHCCTSSRFHAAIKIEIAVLKRGSMTPTFYIDTVMEDYDRNMKMIKYMGTIVENMGGNDETTTNFTNISDYGNGKAYNFGVYSGTPYCNVTQIDPKDMDNGCVPSSLNFTGSFTVGSGSNSVLINSFDGVIGNFHWSMQRTANECAPITYSRFGIEDDGTYMKENGMYLDVVQNVTRTGAFAIPDSCNQVINTMPLG
ncbi:uncharacterized protein LOC123528427 [Mercenaria mercenaria]|uniref:uncharacterized protein LOC123528427 n=1 Tax=Mercenaria mercenaria TaxID=6596 RepID=UPI00234EA680|nr:uncharacterized protein LOC123528427 [Mercenaria mercenaria]